MTMLPCPSPRLGLTIAIEQETVTFGIAIVLATQGE